jgi:hypothetical protein
MGREGARLAQTLFNRSFHEHLPTHSSLFYSMSVCHYTRGSLARCTNLMTASYMNPIQSNPIQSNPIQSNPIQSNPIQSNPIQSNPIHQSTADDDITSAFTKTLASVQAQLLILADQKEVLSQEFGTTANIGCIWGGNRLTVANGMRA